MRISYRNNKKWIVSCVVENYINKPDSKEIENKVLAIDLGLKTLATGVNTNGKVIKVYNKPKKIDKYFSKHIENLRTKQSKCIKNSRQFNYYQKVVRGLYNKKNSQKKNYLHIQVNRLLNMNHHTIILGDLQVKKLMQKEENKAKKVSRSFNRSNISMFVDILTYKAEEKCVNVIKVNETNTTQLNCLTNKLFNERVELGDREVEISKDIIIDRDLNSAINIYARWYNTHLAALTPPLDIFNVLMNNNLKKL
jgi:IS605 OrfB family transposase